LAKLLPLGAFIALAAIAFRMETFRLDFSGLALGVPVWEQVKNTMLITLWVFIGVEGAVVVSARARNKQDVGRATLLAVLSALAVYLLVTLLSLGVVPRSELAEIRNPSMAGLMVNMMGSWGEIVIAAGLIISVCGAYLSWTIMAAEVPYLAATHKAFPRLFARTNKNNAPSASLWLTNVSVQASLVLIWLTGSDYNTLLTIASEMILVPYFLVGAFLLKIAERPLHKAVGVGACIYGLWLLYASGPVHLLLSVILYAPGLLVFLYARRTHQHDRPLKRRDLALIGFLLVAAVPATWMLVG
ncbi:amino acid permease, partial [Klebsiella michiganensis]